MTTLSSPLIYLVIPAYREASRIMSLLHDLEELADELKPLVVQIVEDSGPGEDRERTLKKISPVLERSDLFLPALLPEENLGKGGAVRFGWNAAPEKAQWLGFVDADGSICAAEILRLVKEVRSSGDEAAYFGSRIRMLGRDVDRELHRHLIGRVFATISSITSGIACYDSQCGLKIFPANALRPLLPQFRENGFAFDLELLAFLTDAEVPIREFPVDWHEVSGSSVNMFSDPLKMYLAMTKIQKRRRSVDTG